MADLKRIAEINAKLAALKGGKEAIDEQLAKVTNAGHSSDGGKVGVCLNALLQAPRTKEQLMKMTGSSERSVESFLSYIRTGKYGTGRDNASVAKQQTYGVTKAVKTGEIRITHIPTGDVYFYDFEIKELEEKFKELKPATK